MQNVYKRIIYQEQSCSNVDPCQYNETISHSYYTAVVFKNGTGFPVACKIFYVIMLSYYLFNSTNTTRLLSSGGKTSYLCPLVWLRQRWLLVDRLSFPSNAVWVLFDILFDHQLTCLQTYVKIVRGPRVIYRPTFCLGNLES
jgi:hypothetical protein